MFWKLTNGLWLPFDPDEAWQKAKEDTQKICGEPVKFSEIIPSFSEVMAPPKHHWCKLDPETVAFIDRANRECHRGHTHDSPEGRFLCDELARTVTI